MSNDQRNDIIFQAKNPINHSHEAYRDKIKLQLIHFNSVEFQSTARITGFSQKPANNEQPGFTG